MSFNDLEEGAALAIDFKKLKKVAGIESDTVPVVVQDSTSLQVLIVAYLNKKALTHSLQTGYATFWSTSRNELWEKGATSGDRLKLDGVRINCEQNSLLFLVTKEGKGVCHTHTKNGESRSTCYYREIGLDGALNVMES
ncbi:phosphoribosyl-AMP cyclohydrolase [bacterium]|jgi:phosphoribosyl-AMP cyclohydrolase|nr:phosphoribosyl-AMP cyclohydrolase [bacterium]